MLKELSSYRGKADAVACVERYRDKSIAINTGAEKINSLLRVMEDTRVEILGSLHYPGIATNISSKKSASLVVAPLEPTPPLFWDLYSVSLVLLI